MTNLKNRRLTPRLTQRGLLAALLAGALPGHFAIAAESPPAPAKSSPQATVTFDQLIASVAQPPTPAADKRTKEEQDLARYRASMDAIHARQAAVTAKAGGVEPGDSPNGKQSLRVDIARLEKDVADKPAWDNVALVAPFARDDAHFTKIMLAHIFGRYQDKMPPAVVEAMRKQFSTYPEFLGGGTENHIGMQRVSGAIFGAAFPDAKTIDGKTGKEIRTEAEAWMQRYGRTVFHTGMKEFLSLIYLGVHNEIWLTGAEQGPDDSVRLMSRAMLDWMWSDLAINTNLGQVLPPVTRAKLMLDRSAQATHPQSHAQWLAWLYWGDLRSRPGSEELAPEAKAIAPGASVKQMMRDNDGFQTAIVPAALDRVPNEVIRNIGAKDVPLPYMLLQSRPHGEVIGSLAHAGDGYREKKAAQAPAGSDRTFLRSIYVARNYSIGAGYVRREESGDNENSMHLLPSAMNYRSGDIYNSIFVSHPYWYAGQPTGDPAETNEVFGLDCWLGKSPFEQMLHWENAAIYLYDIPDVDPYAEADAKKPKKEGKEPKEGKELKEGKAPKEGKGKWTSTRAAAPLKKVCTYVPETIDETRQTPWGWLLREGDVYIALRPVGAQSAAWETCTNKVQKGFKRLVMSGSRMALIVEMGDAAEYGSPEAFIAKVGASTVDASTLASKKEVRYVTTRGTPLDIRFNDQSWFPNASVKGAKLDFDHWPICESPYVNCRDGVLDVNDGRSGFTVDWSGELPAYSSYKLEQGKRSVMSREWLEKGVLKRG